MKYISIIILILTLIYPSQFYSQKNPKGLNLKLKDLETVEKDGKTSWRVKTILKNNTRDTLFYFSYADCESAFYRVSKIYFAKDIRNDTLIDDNSLSLDHRSCAGAEQTVISIPPSGKRSVILEIISQKPLTSPIKIIVVLAVHRSKYSHARIPQNDLTQKGEGRIVITSNQIKIKRLVNKN